MDSKTDENRRPFHPLGELRRLRLLVCSYQYDDRFAAVDFGQAHSRFAHLIVDALRQSTTSAANAAAPAAAAAVAATAAPETDWQRIRGELQYTHDTVAALNVPANGPTAADEDLQCVLVHALHYMDNWRDGTGVAASAPLFAAGLTERAARALWTSEERCRCVWSAPPGGAAETEGRRSAARHQQQQQQRRMRRLAKQRADQQQEQTADGWQYRQAVQEQLLVDSDEEGEVDADEDDDEEEYGDESYLVSVCLHQKLSDLHNVCLFGWHFQNGSNHSSSTRFTEMTAITHSISRPFSPVPSPMMTST